MPPTRDAATPGQPGADRPPPAAGTTAVLTTEIGNPADARGDRAPVNRRGIGEAVELVEQLWRAAACRRPLINALTRLDWQARTLRDDQPPDEDLISRIGRLRRQIWLSSEA